MPEDQIRPEGPIPANIMIIGEAPGEQEVKEGRPFVGPAGRVLDGLLRDAGIVREQCYITNVLLWRPDGNNFETVNDSALSEACRRLYSEITRVRPNICVCCGESSFNAVTGLHGITKWRGSVVSSRPECGSAKTIGVIHPAAIAREWSFRQPTLLDFQRVLVQSQFAEIRQTERTYWIRGKEESTGTVFTDAPNGGVSSSGGTTSLTYRSGETGTQADGISLSTTSSTDGRIFIRGNTLIGQTIEHIRALKGAKYVAFDIETESNQITSIALSPDNRPNWAVCIPFWFGSSGSLWSAEEELLLWTEIKEILTDERIGKIAHNGSYDIEFIERTMGFKVHPFSFDTMLGLHTLYLELPKSLAFAVSIYTDHPYYKSDIHSKDMLTYFRYNATDACLTMEIALKLMQEIKEDGLWEFYQDYLHGLVEPLLDMQKRGVKFDFLRRNSIKKRMQEEVAVLQKNLDASIGHPLNVNSPKQMKEWLYGELKYKQKVKKRKDTGQETVTADNEALEDLFRETGNQSLQTVLRIREKQKIISTYLDVALDDDKRIRCSYSITGTETGRLSSSATTRGTGTNLQNVPAGPVRSLFLPDDGYTLINADLSQAEARVVAYLANEYRLIRVFEEGGDIHRKNAANIFKVAESDVTDDQRQLAKRVVHASNYGMGPVTFAKQCNIPVADAKRLLNQYFATYPGIANWHLDIASQLRNKRYLVTPFGRKRYFFNRFNDQLVKEGLAFIPQSTVADIVTKALIKAHKEGLELLLQVHDSLVVQAKKEEVENVARQLREYLTCPVEINGKVLVIPTDIKIGQNWNDLEKYKGPSS